MNKNPIVVYTQEETCIVCNEPCHSGVIVEHNSICDFTCSEKCANKLNAETKPE